jgi:hypothetical protein
LGRGSQNLSNDVHRNHAANKEKGKGQSANGATKMSKKSESERERKERKRKTEREERETARERGNSNREEERKTERENKRKGRERERERGGRRRGRKMESRNDITTFFPQPSLSSSLAALPPFSLFLSSSFPLLFLIHFDSTGAVLPGHTAEVEHAAQTARAAAARASTRGSATPEVRENVRNSKFCRKITGEQGHER